MLPVKPASELTPTPNSRLPVLSSCTLTKMFLYSLSGLLGSSWAVTSTLPGLKMPSRSRFRLATRRSGIGEQLAREFRHLTQDDVVLRPVVADDEDLADAGRRPFDHLVLDLANAGRFLVEQRRHLDAGLAAGGAEVILDAADVFVDCPLVVELARLHGS